MEDLKKKEDLQETEKTESKELDLEALEQVSGGSLAHARLEKTKPITDEVAQRF